MDELRRSIHQNKKNMFGTSEVWFATGLKIDNLLLNISECFCWDLWIKHNWMVHG